MSEIEPKITQPVRVDEEALTQNVYPDSEGLPDDASQDGFSEYLVERMYGADDKVAKKYKPGDEIHRPRLMFDGWLASPRFAAVATVVGFLGINAIVNRHSLGKEISQAADNVKKEVDPDTRTVTDTTPSTPTRTIKESYPINTNGKEQRSGLAEADKVSARGFVRKLKAIKNNGKIKKIEIVGSTSDEWTGDGEKSVGKSDVPNDELGAKRADSFRDDVEAIAKKEGLKLPDIKVAADEHVLNRTDLGELLVDVQKSNYSSVLSAITAYNNGDKSMSPQLRSEIKELIGSRRISTANVTVSQDTKVPGLSSEQNIRVEEVPGEHKHFPYKIIPFLIPPIPRTRREYRDPFAEPPVVREEPLDQVWIELYEEALQGKNQLVEDSWALTRKYQYLYREERITQGLRYDYQDDEGEDQSINVLFIDRPELDEATIEAINGLMFDISLIHGGKVTEALDTITILPSENTGPQRPDKIGLGIDEQYGRSTLGLAIPSIGLTEIQLPKNPTKQNIEDFNGLRWVLAHEVAGHFSDVNSEVSRKVDRTDSNRPGRSYTTRNPWTGAGDDSYATTGRRLLHMKQFAIPHPDGDNEEYIVNPGDEELVEAPAARLRGQGPTRYSDDSPLEIHAETAAAVMTDIPIPAQEAAIPESYLGEKPGYYVDAGLQYRFASHVGALLNTDRLEWDEEQVENRRQSFSVTVLAGELSINDDKDQNKTSETAKNQPYQDEEKRLKILARNQN